MNKDLISKAAGRRLNEVRERLIKLDPQRFGEAGPFVASVKETLGEARAAGAPVRHALSESRDWAEAATDCLTSLRMLSLHSDQGTQPAPYQPAGEFFNRLQAKIVARQNVFELLAERYRWPLNFSFPAEGEVRETVLMRLLTADRVRVEKASIDALNADDLLLKLNLVAVHACATTDLRFLDALNYYYELLPATPYSESQHPWLLVSWFALYVRALSFWS